MSGETLGHNTERTPHSPLPGQAGELGDVCTRSGQLLAEGCSHRDAGYPALPVERTPGARALQVLEAERQVIIMETVELRGAAMNGVQCLLLLRPGRSSNLFVQLFDIGQLLKTSSASSSPGPILCNPSSVFPCHSVQHDFASVLASNTCERLLPSFEPQFF
jgi:hypothetical protein